MPIVGVPATVAAIYTTDAGQSINNNTLTIVDFEDKVQDTHAAVTTGAAWKFTAPSSGFYQVSVAVLFAGTTTWADAEWGWIALYRDGAFVTYLDRKDNYSSASTVYMQLSGSTLVYLTAGSYLDIEIRQNSGAAMVLYADAGFNRVSIVKV